MLLSSFNWKKKKKFNVLNVILKYAAPLGCYCYSCGVNLALQLSFLVYTGLYCGQKYQSDLTKLIN